MTRLKTIGIITPFLDGQYFGGLVYHINQTAKKLGMRLIVITTLRDNNRWDVPLAADTADGWLVIKHSLNPSVLDHLRGLGKPIVGIGHESEFYPCVHLDNRQAMDHSTEHLILHGHRRIAFVGNLKNKSFHERFEGYKDALSRNGIALSDRWVINTDNSSMSGGVDAAEKILKLGTECTAAVTCSDYLTEYMIARLRSAGCRVPDDFAVAAFDDAPRTSLTTVRIPVEEMARKAVELLLAQSSIGSSPAAVHYVHAPLIIRRSCGCTAGSEYDPDGSGYDAGEPYNYIEVLEGMENAVELSRQVSTLLASGNRNRIKRLEWLQNVRTPWACYTQWETKDRCRLTVTSAITDGMHHFPEIGTTSEASRFPLTEQQLDDLYDMDDSRVLVLLHIQSSQRSWGVLAIMLPMEQSVIYYKSNTLTYAFVLFGAALERLELFGENQRISRTLETVLDMTSDGIWELELGSNQLEWSRWFESMLGFRLGPDVGSIVQCIHPDDRLEAEGIISGKFAALAESARMEFRMKRAGREYIWVEATAKAFMNRHGEPERIIGSIREITERKLMEEQIRHMAYHDSITGLPNRTFFLDRLKERIVLAKREGRRIAVLLIDLDRFKLINDHFGHHVGDLVLQHIASQLKKVARKGDLVSRHGGDEFTMLVSNADNEDELRARCDQILQLLAEPFEYNGKPLRITGSVGVSLFPDDGDDLDALINNADVAMYQAKSGGRNRYSPYTNELDTTIRGKMKMEHALHQALLNQEFELYYQPQKDIATGLVVGMEALLRWNSPDLGSVPPLQFIPVAEETELIVPIGDWVLREACRTSARWQKSGFGPFQLSVNISAVQLRADDFVDKVRQMLTETGLSPHLLCLEITESTAIENMDLGFHKMQELIELGVQLALDDFGTGYSSLSVLNKLPFHVLKIDKSFINQLQVEQSNGEVKGAIVKSIIALSHEMNFMTVAEGVESESQLALLRDYGCDFYQGYLFSRPLSERDFEAEIVR